MTTPGAFLLRLAHTVLCAIAARQGDRKAAATIQLIRLRHGSPRRAAKAQATLEQAAGTGCGWAAMALATAYARGWGVHRDPERMVAWLARAAAAK